MLNVSGLEFASEVYLSWKTTTHKKRKPKASISRSAAFQKGNARDPISLAAVMNNLNQNWGWQTEIEIAKIMHDWGSLVGENVAQRTNITAISKGVITVECTSTSWATELRRIRADLITKILKKYPDSGIKEIKFIVSGIPSWNHGFRSVKGKGPRDTYK